MKMTLFSSVFIIFYSMFSGYIQETHNIPDPVVILIVGLLMGKHASEIVVPHYVFSKDIVSVSSRLVLCLQTMVVSLSLPKNYLNKNYKSVFSLVILLGFAKCFCVFVTFKLFSRLDNSTCWAIAASLTPTDPILSSSIIKGKFAQKYVPEKLRMLLSAESGINDGFGILMLSISIDILRNPSLKDGMIQFIIYTLGVKVILSGVIGYLIGMIVQKITKKCCSMELIKSEVMGIHSICLCFLGLALMDIIDGSELICIFFMGIALNNDEWYTLERTSNRISEAIEGVSCKVLFLFLGTVIDFNRFTLRMVLICSVVLIVIRPLSLLLAYKTVPLIKNKKEALFVGWFGPVGVGALYYCLLYDKKVDTLTIDYGICTVFLSTFIHGFSVPIYEVISKRIKKQEEFTVV